MVLQKIAHPSNVWSCIQLPNGDIVTGCADSVIRVFTRYVPLLAFTQCH